MNEIAKVLNLQREELGLTKDQVRELASVGPTQVTAVFRGDWQTLQWSTVLKFAKALV